MDTFTGKKKPRHKCRNAALKHILYGKNQTSLFDLTFGSFSDVIGVQGSGSAIKLGGQRNFCTVGAMNNGCE